MERALVLSLVGLACGEGPDDLFVIGGSTLRQDGSALDGVPITALRTFGGNCEGGTRLQGTRSADGGLFSFDFIRVEVQSLSGETTTCVRLQADFESGTTAWMNMYYFPNRLTLPPFSDWSAQLRLDLGPDGGVPRFTPVLPEGGPKRVCLGNFPEEEEVAHGIVARLADGALAWEQTDRITRYEMLDAGVLGSQISMPAPFVIPYAAFEDFDLDLSIGAKRTGCVEASGGGGFGAPGLYQTITRWSAPGSAHVRGTRLPVSRGATCDGFVGSCPLTDGDPRARTFFERPVNNFRIRLARSASISAIVIRDGLVDTTLLAGERVSIRVGTDSETVTILDLPDPLDQIEFFGVSDVGQRSWRYIPLGRKVGPGSTVELEFDRLFYRMGELSLFEEP